MFSKIAATTDTRMIPVGRPLPSGLTVTRIAAGRLSRFCPLRAALLTLQKAPLCRFLHTDAPMQTLQLVVQTLDAKVQGGSKGQGRELTDGKLTL